MATVTVKRPVRTLPPEYSKGELRLKAPPTLPRKGSESVALMLMPMMGMGGSAAFFFLPGSHPFMRVMGAVMVVSTLVMALAQIVRALRGPATYMNGERRDYLRHLAHAREEVRETARRQRRSECYAFPEPAQLWAVVAHRRRLWERRPADVDFAEVRIGRGPQKLATTLVVPRAEPADEWDPLAEHALRQFLAAYGQLDDLPLAVSLRAFPRLLIRGDAEAVYGAVRAIVCQLAALHSPDDLRIAVVAAPGALPEWDWVKWLPHVQHHRAVDGTGPGLLVCRSLDALEELLAEELTTRPEFQRDAQPLLDRPHLVVLKEQGSGVGWEERLGMTVLEVEPGSDLGRDGYGQSVLTVSPGELRLESGAGAAYEGVPDFLSGTEAVALARALAPLRSHAEEDVDPLVGDLDFAELMGINAPASLDVTQAWRPRGPQGRLRVPIGVDGDGSPLALDLKEASQGGMGPHGLCVGATGSGKSELLRTLVLGLAATHSSETLNFILADFKGGATFAGLADLPHVAALITNLVEDLALVDRMHDAVTSEMTRRQELLHSSGNFANIHDYEKARAAGAQLEPLPSLLIVLDEFSELLAARPDFLQMFLRIGRIGRSLGIHLLLATQRLEEGQLHGLDTYLSYRLVMRTFSADESRAALGTPAAYYLPPVPGAGLLQHGTEPATQFKSAYVSAPHQAVATPVVGQRVVERSPVLFTAESACATFDEPASEQEANPQAATAPAETVLDVIVDRLAGQGAPARQIWLPPLEISPSLGQLLPPTSITAERGLHAADPQTLSLTIPLGIADKPLEQCREILTQDLSGPGGHVVVTGGPRSGKSTLLRTLILSLSLTHTPREVQFYCVDYGGGSLFSLAGLPHVGGVASRLEAGKVRRSVAEVMGILREREEFFHAHHIDSMQTYRVRRADGHYDDHLWGDVFLVIDGWAAFKREWENLVPDIEALALRGLAYGVHLVIVASRYNEMRPALTDEFGARLELRLADPLDSAHDRKRARNIPINRPGHGLAAGGLHFVTALPHLDNPDSGSVDSPAWSSEQLVAQIETHWSGSVCPPVRMLPDRLSADDLPKASETLELGCAIGVEEATLSPVYVNLDTDPLLVIYGESESGKSALLRLITQRIADQHQPHEALLLVGDYRRGLFGHLPQDHVLHYAPAVGSLEQGLAQLGPLLGTRMPTEDTTAEQMRARSWWQGPEVFVVIDDYDLVALPSGNPLEAIAEYLPYAGDIGLRVIVARSTAGAARATFEPVTRRLKELGAQGIILSGAPEEGPLIGTTKATPMPPGRAQFVPRRGPTGLVQIGFLPTAS
ncbi:type VII secretion protein EccCa [Streptomyces nigrescens]|uniref:Type VII secretion protein EccCa n=1 Tax=Streptomyces nigrescens TaxID=1920 RepID=A0ABY7J402_STRNI|nr:type VII secretion protein EccCa [Streptomyces nigrescens]WAU04834.1 type VII secretion protein EccCa [Streptomyces nigrescens]